MVLVLECQFRWWRIDMIRKLAVLLLFAIPTFGQSSSGIIAPSRAINWTNGGVPGGIPDSSWLQCGTALAASTSAATINATMAGCAPLTFVFLNPGSGTWTTAIIMQSGVVLRASGANATFITANISSNSSCGGNGAVVCFMGENTYYGSSWVQPGGAQAATWSGGYSQGTTSITLTSVGGTPPTVGQYIYLDQANSGSDNGNFFVCDKTSPPCSLEGGSPGRTIGGVDHNQVQAVKVTGIAGSTYTISPGIYAPNIASGFSPGAWWPHVQLTNSGIENISIDGTNGGGQSNFIFYNSFNCWVSGVRSIAGGARNHVWFTEAFHNTIQNSYLYGSPGGGPGHYGYEEFIAGDNAIINTIVQQVTAPIIDGVSSGSVFLYNFSIGNIESPTGFMEPAYWAAHDAGSMYHLWEGNEGSSTYADVFHGTGGLNTYFRNYFNCNESTATTNRSCALIFAYNRYYHFIGNVFGSGVQTTYQTTSGVGADKFIWNLNAGDTESGITVPSDSIVSSSLLRWGNYDTVTAAVRWCGNSSDTGWSTTCGSTSEVPTSAPVYPNTVPTLGDTGIGQGLMPKSFYYPAKPPFFAVTDPWPLNGPEVTSGSVSGVGGHANFNPAHECYNSMGGPSDGSGSVLSFTPAACPYLNSGAVAGPTSTLIIISSTSTVPTGQTAQFSASCGSNPCGALTWKSNVGPITANGVLIAVSTPISGSVSVSSGGLTSTIPVNVISVSPQFQSGTCKYTETLPVPTQRTITINGCSGNVCNCK